MANCRQALSVESVTFAGNSHLPRGMMVMGILWRNPSTRFHTPTFGPFSTNESQMASSDG